MNQNEINRQSIRASSNRLYRDCGLLQRLMAKHRADIAPIDAVLNHVPLNARVLDMGCGIGLLLNVLADHGRLGAGSLGVDVSDHAIATARAAAARFSSEVMIIPEFFCASPDAPLPYQSYDCVMLVDVMHHIPPKSQIEFLATVATVVAPGGRLIYKDMCHRPRWRATMNRVHDLLMARQWINYLPIDQVEKEFRRFDLVLGHREDRNMLWYGHELRIFHRRAEQ